MNVKKANKARSLKAKGWSLRDIASEIGMSHEAVRVVLGDLPAHMAPVAKPRRAKRSRPPAGGSLLDVCRALLAELRRRAKATTHPTLGTRYSADATNLAGLVLRLETEAATREEGLLLSRADIVAAHDSLQRKMLGFIEAARRRGDLLCVVCRCELDIELPDEGPPVPPEAPTQAPEAFSPAGMVEEARAALTWLLDSTADAEAIGNEMAVQRSGRAAVSIAGFVARLEKAIAKTRQDVCNVPPVEIAIADGSNATRIQAMADRGPGFRCPDCSRAQSRAWGAGQ